MTSEIEKINEAMMAAHSIFNETKNHSVKKAAYDFTNSALKLKQALYEESKT